MSGKCLGIFHLTPCNFIFLFRNNCFEKCNLWWNVYRHCHNDEHKMLGLGQCEMAIPIWIGTNKSLQMQIFLSFILQFIRWLYCKRCILCKSERYKLLIEFTNNISILQATKRNIEGLDDGHQASLDVISAKINSRIKRCVIYQMQYIPDNNGDIMSRSTYVSIRAPKRAKCCE